MIGLDANVVLRFLVKDDPEQARLAKALMESLTSDCPGWISLVVLAEVVWSLKKTYRLGKDQIAAIVERLMANRFIAVEQGDKVDAALSLHRSTRAGFADCLLSVTTRSAGCAKVVTFDKIAARDLGMELLGSPTV